MKNIHEKLLLALGLTAVVALSPFVHGEEGKTSKQGDGKGEKFANEMGLTEEQKTKMKALSESRKSEMQAMHAKYDAQIKQILTPEQYAKFESKKQEHKGRWHDHKKGDAKKE
ncbi:MAG: hypothetical protein SGI71_12365 [Verrucomicrobiota bacterium]|nr:hypothetical protein [Verrucomicrobiota bacterium]